MFADHLDPVSNREDWTVTVAVADDNTGGVVDITDATITVTVRDIKTKSEALTATNGDGVTITSGVDGIYEWAFTAEEMSGVCPGTYEVGVICVLNGTTSQLLIGTVPILDGIVT
jgi:hypothetical protein